MLNNQYAADTCVYGSAEGVSKIERKIFISLLDDRLHSTKGTALNQF